METKQIARDKINVINSHHLEARKKQKITILVTGSAGFIGFHTAKKLLEDGCKVVGLDNFNSYYKPALKEARNRILEGFKGYKLYRGDLENLELIKKVFKENKIDKVCHLAAQAGVRYSLENPHAYISSNLVGFTNIIEEAKNAGIKTFVYASSSSVYGNNKKIPFSINDSVDKPISLYAATKKANELIAYTYHHLYGLNCTGLRFFTVYGPWGRPDMAAYKFADAIKNNRVVDVYNFGKMKRDFTFITDIVSGILSSLKNSYPYEIFNLGNNQPVELGSFINIIEGLLGEKAKKKFLPLQPGDVPETYANISHSYKKLGYRPKINIEEGLKEFINWYKNYDKN